MRCVHTSSAIAEAVSCTSTSREGTPSPNVTRDSNDCFSSQYLKHAAVREFAARCFAHVPRWKHKKHGAHSRSDGSGCTSTWPVSSSWRNASSPYGSAGRTQCMRCAVLKTATRTHGTDRACVCHRQRCILSKHVALPYGAISGNRNVRACDNERAPILPPAAPARALCAAGRP